MPRAKRSSPPAPLEERLGYVFANSALLREALTHSSARMQRHLTDAAPGDNQRLEFLGDRVLGLAIAEMLLHRFPEAREKELARLFNRLVRGETCAAVARALELGPDLIMDAGEAGAGGRRKDSILADACEALLGAIFVDGGFPAARAVIHTHWTPQLDDAPPPSADAKTALQEWAQGRKLNIPHYVKVTAEGPDHAPSFTIEVRVGALAPARGVGASIRIAQQAAAAAMLMREGVWSEA